jgi:hypothetical protein
MMSGTRNVIRGTWLALASLGTVMGLALPAAAYSPAGHPELRRIRPTVTVQQCERAGGVVEARSGAKARCVGGIDDGDPVVGE